MRYGLWSAAAATPADEVLRQRSVIIETLSTCLRREMMRAAMAGDWYRSALARESEMRAQFPRDAKRIRTDQSRILTREYANRVVGVASLAREVTCIASEVWVPAPDISGSGLDQAELDLVCEVIGSAQFASRRMV